MVPPAFSVPLLSASSIIDRATLSLMLPQGFLYSSFAYRFAFKPFAAAKREISSIGVLPIRSVMSFAIIFFTGYRLQVSVGTAYAVQSNQKNL